VHVSAKDLGTGKEQKIAITASSGLSKDDVEKMVREAESHAAEDKKQREAIAAVKTALAGSDPAAIRAAGETLDRERLKFGEAVYRAASAAGAAPGTGGEPADPAAKPADDVIDAEVVDADYRKN